MADKRIDRGRTTRRLIIDEASALFARDGYEAVSIEAVLAACAISRGALYHHFPGKEAVFRAVLDVIEADVARQVSAAAQGAANPLDALRAGCAAWLSLAGGDATVRRVVMIDAPSVLGWQAWRAIDGEHSLGLLKAALALGAAAGRLRADRIDVSAHVLLAVLIEVALLIARAPDDAATLAAGQDAVEQVLSGLFGLAPGGAW